MIIFTGIQASGKSTFYKKMFIDTHIRINLDMLKTRHRELLLIKACLEAKQPLVIDNTNPTLEDRKKYIQLAKQYHFRTVGYYFVPQLTESATRNQQREEKKRVPLIAIKGTLNKLEPPHSDEGFDQLFQVTIQGNDYIICDY